MDVYQETASDPGTALQPERPHQGFWMIGGALLVAGVSLLIAFGRVPSVYVPMPIYLVITAWIASYLYVVVTPSLYLIATHIICTWERAFPIMTAVYVGVAVLNVLYFRAAMDYGIQFQGEQHVEIVTVQNFVGCLNVITLAGFAWMDRSRQKMLIANLLFFVVMSWCAFPYLGELP